MKITFGNIRQRLDDPSFETLTLGREAVRMRIFPPQDYGPGDCKFSFTDWNRTDDEVLTVSYSYFDTRIGRVLIADTPKGICYLGFALHDDIEVKNDLMRRFPRNSFKEEITANQKAAAAYCDGDYDTYMPLHLKGTDFQVRIWRQLVGIAEGCLTTYGMLGAATQMSRAVGGAVGANPVSYIIPCHRVVRSDGSINGYYWGPEIKKMLLAYELRSAL